MLAYSKALSLAHTQAEAVGLKQGSEIIDKKPLAQDEVVDSFAKCTLWLDY